jgi:hypothetical protein
MGIRCGESEEGGSLLWNRSMEDHVRFKDRAASLSTLEYFETFAPALLLYGFAVENLVKALLIVTMRAQRRSALTETEWQRYSRITQLDRGDLGSIFNHETTALLERAGLQLTDGERNELARLRVFSDWVGRYPSPKAPDRMREGVRETGALPSQEEANAIESLFDRLKSNIRERTRAGFGRERNRADEA